MTRSQPHLRQGYTDILGNKVQGDKVTANVGGSLNIETLQEKELYEDLSFSDLEDEADYSAKSIGAASHKYGNCGNTPPYNRIGFTIRKALRRTSPCRSRKVQAAGQNLAEDISRLKVSMLRNRSTALFKLDTAESAVISKHCKLPLSSSEKYGIEIRLREEKRWTNRW